MHKHTVGQYLERIVLYSLLPLLILQGCGTSQFSKDHQQFMQLYMDATSSFQRIAEEEKLEKGLAIINSDRLNVVIEELRPLADRMNNEQKTEKENTIFERDIKEVIENLEFLSYAAKMGYWELPSDLDRMRVFGIYNRVKSHRGNYEAGM